MFRLTIQIDRELREVGQDGLHNNFEGEATIITREGAHAALESALETMKVPNR